MVRIENDEGKFSYDYHTFALQQKIEVPVTEAPIWLEKKKFEIDPPQKAEKAKKDLEKDKEEKKKELKKPFT
jgi:hypothetical protein